MGRQETSPGGQIASNGAEVGKTEGGQNDRLRRRAIRLEYFTIAWNVVEAAVALVAGWVASSIALEGFGLDSIIETISGLTLLWRLTQPPLEAERAEKRAVRIVGMTFFALAAYVSYEAAADLWLHRVPQFSLPGLILAAASLIAMPVLGLAKRHAARQLNSRALAADAIETLLCSYLSATLLVGLALSGWFGWWWADPIAALGMVAFMIREGSEALSQ